MHYYFHGPLFYDVLSLIVVLTTLDKSMPLYVECVDSPVTRLTYGGLFKIIIVKHFSGSLADSSVLLNSYFIIQQ